MEPVQTRTACIVRRVKRKGIGFFGLAPFDPTFALPEELTFEVLDEKGRITGNIVCTNMGFRWLGGEDTVLTTPWGTGRVGPSKGAVRVLLDERELFQLSGRLLQKGVDLVTPTGVKLQFKNLEGRRDDIQYSDEKGHVLVVQEKGKLTGTEPGRPVRKTKDEIRMMAKSDRPSSTESLDYEQFRISLGGVTPVPEKELVAGLALLVVFGFLVKETPIPGP